jgi:ribose-phosphate pyrophosphokinase
MIAFPAQPYYARFADELAAIDPEVRVGRPQVVRFPDGELCISPRQGVVGQDCLVAGSIAPPDSQMLECLLLADALKRGGANSVWAFFPYLAYARQDKSMPGMGGGIKAIGSLLKASGIDGVVTIDLHSQLDNKLLGLPVMSLMPTSLFAQEIQRLNWPDITVVAPDEGAIHRNELLADALGIHASVVHLVKTKASIVHLGLVGEVGRRVVIADDILDSGRTLVSACNVLRQSGVKEIAVAVTHGLFTGEIWKELFGLGISDLFVTDSSPAALKSERPEVKVVPIAPLMPTVLAAIRKEVKNGFANAK